MYTQRSVTGKPGLVIKTGLSLGAVLAITVSFSLNQSIFWAIVHGCFGWLYVIYYVIFK